MKRPIRMAAAVAALAIATTEVVPVGAVADKVGREKNRAKTNSKVWNNRGALARKTLSYKSNGDTKQVYGDRKRLSNDSPESNERRPAGLRPDSNSRQPSSKTLSKDVSSSQRQLGSTRAQRLGGARAKANKIRPLRDMHSSTSWDRQTWDRPSWDRPRDWSQSWSSGQGGGGKSGKRGKRGKRGNYLRAYGGYWGNLWGGRADCWDIEPTSYPTLKNEDLEPTLAPSLNPSLVSVTMLLTRC